MRLGIDPKLVSLWTDNELIEEIARQNDLAAYHTKKSAEALQEAREIAAQISIRHPDLQSASPAPRATLGGKRF